MGKSKAAVEKLAGKLSASAADPLLDLDQAAQIADVHPTTILRWSRLGLISFVRVGIHGKKFRRRTFLKEIVEEVPATKNPAAKGAR